METREDGKKQKAYVAITSSTSYFHSLSSYKVGGGGGKSKRGRKGGRVGRGQERGLLKNKIVSSVRIYLQWS